MKVTIEKVSCNSENRFHQKSSYTTLRCFTETREEIMMFATNLYLEGKLCGKKLIELTKKLPKWLQQNNIDAIENIFN